MLKRRERCHACGEWAFETDSNGMCRPCANWAWGVTDEKGEEDA